MKTSFKGTKLEFFPFEHFKSFCVSVVTSIDYSMFLGLVDKQSGCEFSRKCDFTLLHLKNHEWVLIRWYDKLYEVVNLITIQVSLFEPPLFVSLKEVWPRVRGGGVKEEKYPCGKEIRTLGVHTLLKSYHNSKMQM